jgi:CheY-like chemotaxis protein
MQRDFGNDRQRAFDRDDGLTSPGLMRLLVIDDDDCIGAAIRAIVSRRGFETVLASRAHAGIHAFQSSAFDVVIVDLFMPGMNGLDTIERIRAISSVPIIAISGFALRNSLKPGLGFFDMAASRGATICLRKPFSASQLIDAINQGLALPSSVEKSMQ